MKKTWTLKFSKVVEKKLDTLDPTVRKRILAFFYQRVLKQNDPKLFGKPLTAGLSGYWSYRIGDYRVLADIQEEKLIIFAFDIGHRSTIYH